MRSGTLAAHQIAGMGEAFYLAEKEGEQENIKIKALRENFLQGLAPIKNLRVNAAHQTVPHIVNLRFEGMLAEAVLNQLPELACSTASACLGKGTEGSYVLRAMGLSEEEVKSSMRFSFGRFTELDEINAVIYSLLSVFNLSSKKGL